jgi:hypothetical protein
MCLLGTCEQENKKAFPAPSLGMVSKNIILAAIHINNACGPRRRGNWNYGERCAVCCHAKRSE